MTSLKNQSKDETGDWNKERHNKRNILGTIPCKSTFYAVIQKLSLRWRPKIHSHFMVTVRQAFTGIHLAFLQFMAKPVINIQIRALPSPQAFL